MPAAAVPAAAAPLAIAVPAVAAVPARAVPAVPKPPSTALPAAVPARASAPIAPYLSNLPAPDLANALVVFQAPLTNGLPNLSKPLAAISPATVPSAVSRRPPSFSPSSFFSFLPRTLSAIAPLIAPPTPLALFLIRDNLSGDSPFCSSFWSSCQEPSLRPSPASPRIFLGLGIRSSRRA